MKSKWLEQNFLYDGSQLHSLFAYLEHGVQGDSIVAWEGPCEIPFDHMVDGEDLRAGARIAGSHMVHFIVEIFDIRLRTAVALQRLLASLCIETLREIVTDSEGRARMTQIRRDGDDVYVENRKLSISIATVSPVSAMIHFAVNCSNQGTPVPTLALADFSLSSEEFARRLMEKFTAEIESIEEAVRKVHWVR